MDDEPTGKAKGGIARAESLSPTQRSEIARKAASARWDETIPKATHEGTLKIGDIEFPCSVLKDRTRILSEMKFMEGMGMYRSGALSIRRKADDDSGAKMPLFLSYKNLIPFIPKYLDDVQTAAFKYRTLSGNTAHGIRAELIPKICEIWLDARKQGVLGKRQEDIADHAEMILRGLAHVGIIALVDEATGYQSVRARDALEKILEAYIADHLLRWAKRFPDVFYREMFRLKGWNYSELASSGKRPGVVGKYTNDIVYERLAPGVLDELRKKNPPNASGNRLYKHHQWLTEDVGHPALRDHLMGVIALMRASRNWEDFKRTLARVYPKCNEQLLLTGVDDPN